jgi:hypothetical protein
VLGVLVLLIAGGLVYTQASQAHRPNRGLAAGYFEAGVQLCAPSKRCDWYGLARCGPWGPHSVACSIRAIDYRGPFRIKHHCGGWGVVDHRYRIVQLRTWCD